jgi:erythromycin esterase
MKILKIVSTTFFIVCLSSFSKGQNLPSYIPLSYSNPINPLNDLEQLDVFFEGVQIVGMGESTHGTHEFNTMRHRFFKYLVLNHKFNTLFLEADYANCLMANEYVHGAAIDKYEAINNLDLWPWMTEEIGDLFDWMRSYNLENADSIQLNIIGVDMQMYNSTLNEIDKLLFKYGIQSTDTIKYKPIAEADFYRLSKKEILPFSQLLRDKESVDYRSFSNYDQICYSVLLRHLSQIIESKKYPKDYKFRDRKMGENILFNIKNNDTIKGLFWAHNGHLFNVYKEKKGKVTGTAGGILKYYLQTKYLCVVQEFDEGSFNAYNKPNASLKDKSLKGFKL